jgi:uncharacterized RDD family membrane protein YckC
MEDNATTQNTSGKAELAKRALAFIIDSVISGAIGIIPYIGGLVGAAYMLLRDGLDLEFIKQRSLGKKLMKLRPVRLDGKPMDMESSVKRNWMFALSGITQVLVHIQIPILGILLAVIIGVIGFIVGVMEIIFVLKDPEGRRWGDTIAGTKVIEVDE